MAAPVLKMVPIANLSHLPSASPNLMPFHIGHNGPALISTYFLVEAASEHVGRPPPPPVTALEQESEMAVEKADALSEPESIVSDPQPPIGSAFSKRVTEATTRFMATFRGRVMQGLKIELPSGYSGVILAGEGAAGKSKTPAIKAKIKRVNKPKSKGRATRSATRADDDEDMDGEGDVHEDDDSRKTRTLIPTAQFSSFVLWHPDIPVDAGRDEYLRSLTEWIRLSDEIHRFEE